MCEELLASFALYKIIWLMFSVNCAVVFHILTVTVYFAQRLISSKVDVLQVLAAEH